MAENKSDNKSIDYKNNNKNLRQSDPIYYKSSVLLEKSISENNLLNSIRSAKPWFEFPAKHCGKALQISRGIYRYKNPIDEIFPLSASAEMLPTKIEESKNVSAVINSSNNIQNSTKNPQNSPPLKSCKIPTMAINEEGEIMQNSIISPLNSPPRSRCVFIGEFTRECAFNALRISRKWDHSLKYIVGFHSYFIKSCCQLLKSHINQFTSGGAFINGTFSDLLERIIKDSKGYKYSLCVDVSNNEELALIEPLLQAADSYIICSKLPMLSRLAQYTDYLFISKSAGISRQYEANLRKKSTCMVATRNMLKYSMGYKLSVLAYYLDKLEEHEYIVAVNPFNSVVMNLWYLPYWQGFKIREESNNAFYYPIGCIMGYFTSCGDSHKRAIKTYYIKNYRAKKMQTVLEERGNPLSFLYKHYLPKDVFLIIFDFAF